MVVWMPRKTPTPTAGRQVWLYGVAGAGSVSAYRSGVDRQARILVFIGEIERPETDHKPAVRVIYSEAEAKVSNRPKPAVSGRQFTYGLVHI